MTDRVQVTEVSFGNIEVRNFPKKTELRFLETDVLSAPPPYSEVRAV